MREKDKLWVRIKKDFPGDTALQEVHYAHLKIREKTKGMSDQEFVRFIRMQAEKVIKEG